VRFRRRPPRLSYVPNVEKGFQDVSIIGEEEGADSTRTKISSGLTDGHGARGEGDDFGVPLPVPCLRE